MFLIKKNSAKLLQQISGLHSTCEEVVTGTVARYSSDQCAYGSAGLCVRNPRLSRPCHSDLRSPISIMRSPIPVSDIDLRPRPCSTQLYIIAVAPRCLFGLGPFGLHQSLYLDTARTTPSITEQSMLRQTLRTRDTIDTLTDPTLPDP
jgi:hypothetical protein